MLPKKPQVPLKLQQRQKLSKSSKIGKKELKRLLQLTVFEEEARKSGFSSIAGIDEAGRGPLAGPVVAAACIIPPGIFFPGIDDSKKLLPVQRKSLFEQLQADNRVVYGVGMVDSIEIDSINIFQATIKAMLQAVSQLMLLPDFLLVDGLSLPHPIIPCLKIIEGDAKSQSIAAASIIAKETRDEIMRNFHTQWPEYGFNQHKGYATPQHIAAIEKHGHCPIHRKSFKLKCLDEQLEFAF